MRRLLKCIGAGVAQLARARAFQARCRGFEPRFPLQACLFGVRAGGQDKVWADVAQLVERILGKDEVTGSTPVIGSSNRLGCGTLRRRHSATGLKLQNTMTHGTWYVNGNGYPGSRSGGGIVGILHHAAGSNHP